MKTDVWAYGVLLFELFSMGDIPYEGLENNQILDYLEEGNRLSQPDNCTDQAYEIMCNCWEANPEDRRSFTEICQRLLTIMESSNVFYNYIDISVQIEIRNEDSVDDSSSQAGPSGFDYTNHNNRFTSQHSELDNISYSEI